MPRYSAGAKTSAGSTTLPLISLYAAAGVAPKVKEIGISNTTNSAFDIKLVRLSTQGTPGSGLAESPTDADSVAASGTAFNTHSVGPTVGVDLGYRFSIGAAIGAGVIWTFAGDGIRIPTGTANGVGVIVENGSGQPAQAYIVWDE